MQIDWKLDWKFLFLSFHGRIGRIHFWIAFLLLVGASVVVQLIPIIGQLALLLTFWPHLAIQAKRLHDIGRSAWLSAIPPLFIFSVVFVAIIVGGPRVMALLNRNNAGAAAEATEVIVLAVVVTLTMLFVPPSFLLWIGLTRSQPRCNRYGPLPEVR